MNSLAGGYHIIEVDFVPHMLCRVCGVGLEDSAPRYRGNICIYCYNERQREYYLEHREQCRRYIDPAKQKVASRKWYKANRAAKHTKTGEEYREEIKI